MPSIPPPEKGTRHPLRVVELEDPETGARVTRYEHAAGDAQAFYYSTPAATRDGRWIVCWSSASGAWQIHALDRREGVSLQLTEGETSFDADAPCLDADRLRVYYRNGPCVRFVDLRTLEDDWLFEIPEGFEGLHLGCAGDTLAFSFYERFAVGRARDGKRIGGGNAVLHYRPRSIIVAVDLRDLSAAHVWGDHNFLTHVCVAPWDPSLILFADQSWPHRQQELFVVERDFLEAKRPRQLFTGLGLNYVGHAWLTADGFVAAQYCEYLGVDARGRHTDTVCANTICRPDGTGVRRARFPGSLKPCHCHAQRADGPWVGDGWVKPDGTLDDGWLCLMHNRFVTQEMDIQPLCRTGHVWRRPFHPHPWLSWDEREVVFASNWGGPRNHIGVVEIPQRMQMPSA